MGYGVRQSARSSSWSGQNAEAFGALASLGFGHVEVGTVTLRPQSGNPKPRVWRSSKERALLNALGFPSDGAQAVAERLEQVVGNAESSQRAYRLGVNIGKNKDTSNTSAVEDYVQLTGRLARFADYLAINVSSPNTPGLRLLQQAESVVELLQTVRRAAVASRVRTSRLPILIKVSPDLGRPRSENCVRRPSKAMRTALLRQIRQLFATVSRLV